MKTISTVLVLFFTICSFFATGQSKAEDKAWAFAEKIVNNLKDPVFPDKTYDIKDFGAVADGVTDCSEAIKTAIDKCNQEGGGMVLISGGVYLTGPIHMKSNVNLHISENTTLNFSTDPKDYLPLVLTRWEGDACYNYSPLIYADGQNNFAITW